MAVCWYMYNEVTNVLTVWREQNIQNQLDIVRNKVVYEKVSVTLQQQLPSFFFSFFTSYFLHFLTIFVCNAA